jgi:hypothetical protein
VNTIGVRKTTFETFHFSRILLKNNAVEATEMTCSVLDEGAGELIKYAKNNVRDFGMEILFLSMTKFDRKKNEKCVLD